MPARPPAWIAVALALSAAATALTWTVLRPRLAITDGWPGTEDPLTPLGVALVNAALVAAIWIAVAVLARLVGFVARRSRR